MSVASGIDTITFGRYFQNGDSPDPIEWYIIFTDEVNKKRLLISKCGLDKIPYHRTEGVVAWRDCFLRGWLNNDFFRVAFTSEEQEHIVPYEVPNCDCVDSVFCLNEAEFYKYLITDTLKVAFGTKLIDSKFDIDSYNKLSSLGVEAVEKANKSKLYCTYRLREDVHGDYDHSISYWIPGYCEVGNSPFCHMPSITWDTIAIRPAIWIRG